MNDGYALRYLGKVMGWDFAEENRETTWLRVVSDFKYDSYRDFWAGSRFAEALLDWLQQFAPADRKLAYQLVRERLVFISATELQVLVHRTLPVFGRELIVRRIAAKSHVPKYLIWSREDTRRQYHDILTRTLFIGLSDGARIDGFRRASTGVISNEQVVLGYEISDEKWADIRKELVKRTGDQNAKFEVVFLLDDFIGSGKTLFRHEEKGWKGKLTKFAAAYQTQKDLFAPDCAIAVHHYIGTHQAKQNLDELFLRATGEAGPAAWFAGPVSVTFDLLLPANIVLTRGKCAPFDALIEKYYDPKIITQSLSVGETVDVRYGFAECGLPLVIEHNTPNNSLALIWAESPGSAAETAHTMRPLFRRRQRHS